MGDWTSGYICDLPYTHGYYRSLAPSMQVLVRQTKGIGGPAIQQIESYCELGCGQGFSANLLAAANPHIQFHATDFNPAQIAAAKALASEAELDNMHFYDQDFESFGKEENLPDQFDIISLHGVYSWISEENRQHIADFIQTRLKPGGMAYISYNVMPGWAPLMPLRQMMVHAAEGIAGPTGQRVKKAIEITKNLLATNPFYAKANPSILEAFKSIETKDANYVAHEYFNEHWTPFYFSQIARQLSGAKLEHLAGSDPIELLDAINLSPDQASHLASISDPVAKQEQRDFILNTRFRRDLFMKGKVELPAWQSRKEWEKLQFVLSIPRERMRFSLKTPRGEADLKPDFYNEILDHFENGPADFAGLIKKMAKPNLTFERLQHSVLLLVSQGSLQPVLPKKGYTKRKEQTDKLNAAICRRAFYGSRLQHIASPMTGGAVRLDRYQQLFLLALEKGEQDPVLWIHQKLEKQSKPDLLVSSKLTQKAKGKAVTSEAELEEQSRRLEKLSQYYVDFVRRDLPALNRLGIGPKVDKAKSSPDETEQAKAS